MTKAPDNFVTVEVQVTSDQPNQNGDAFAVGQLRHYASTGKPLPRVQHIDIDPKSWERIVAARRETVGTVLSCRWYCPMCHAELPGEHKPDCCHRK